MSKNVFKSCRQRIIRFFSSIIDRFSHDPYSLSYEKPVSITEIIKSMGQFLEKPRMEKHNSQGENDDIRYGLGSMQGWRIEMEDAHATILRLNDKTWPNWSYFGVFDGHSGYRTAIKAAEKLHLHIVSSLDSLTADNTNGMSSSHVLSSQLDFEKLKIAIKDAYFTFDQEWREENRNNNQDERSGSTAISCLIDKEQIYFLNVGDSRAILVSNTGRVLLATKDHKPNDQIERQRIQEAGGTVLIQRVNGSLAVSRALGDFEYKNNSNRPPDQQLVSPEPEITCHARNLATDSDKPEEQIAFIVLACDGIWDVMSNEALAAYILDRMHVTDDLSEICNSVLDMCLYKGSKDNMSLIIIAFKSAPVPTPERKAKDETLNNEIRKKTIEIFNCNSNQAYQDANTTWQQVVKSLNEQSSIRDALLANGGFLSKRSIFESTLNSLMAEKDHTGISNNGSIIDGEHCDATDIQSDLSPNSSSVEISSSTNNNLATLTQ